MVVEGAESFEPAQSAAWNQRGRNSGAGGHGQDQYSALGDRGLIVYDASDPVSKPLAAEVFARELATAGQTARLAAATGSDLLARGYHAQVQVQDDSLALFRLDGSRLAIRRQGPDWWSPVAPSAYAATG